MDVIADYTTELDRLLRGPRRMRADLVAEARDSLTDAAEAYGHDDADRERATARAVEDFGPLREVASGYQAVLATAQARRTAVLFFVITAAQTLSATYEWRTLSQDQGWTFQPGPGYSLLASTVDWVGIGNKVAALLVLLATSIGVRYLGHRRAISWFMGVLTLAVGGFMLVAGALLTSLNPALMASYQDQPYLWFLYAISLAPGACLAVSAWHCISAARPVPEPAEISPAVCRTGTAPFDA